MEQDKIQQIKKLYARIVGIRDGLPNRSFRWIIAEDFNRTLKSLASLLEENLDYYEIPESAEFKEPGGSLCNYDIGISKIYQIIRYLEMGYGLGDRIVEIGSLVNAIQDQELKDRCLDLLSAVANFDRVINQATLILEDRIRKKSEIPERLEGVKLINKVLNQDFNKTILKISDDSDEQRGFCDVCRGIMSTFRNPTHHYITDKFTREDALKFCGFIDIILSILEKAQKIR